MELKEIIKEVRNIAQQYIKIGKLQQEHFAKVDSSKPLVGGTINGKDWLKINGILVPKRVAAHLLMCEPNSYRWVMLEGFWSLYDAIATDIQSQLTRFTIRPLIDICYNQILFFESLSSTRQKEIAVSHQLCAIGSAIADNDDSSESTLYQEAYPLVLAQLSSSGDQKKFETYMKQGFPLPSFSREMTRLSGSLSNEEVVKQMQASVNLMGIFNSKIDKKRLQAWYLRYSSYIHGNPYYMKVLAQQKETNQHLFSTVTMLFVLANQIIIYGRKIAPEANASVDKVEEAIKSLAPHLFKFSTLADPQN